MEGCFTSTEPRLPVPSNGPTAVWAGNKVPGPRQDQGYDGHLQDPHVQVALPESRSQNFALEKSGQSDLLYCVLPFPFISLNKLPGGTWLP